MNAEDAEGWIMIGLVGVGLYVAYQIVNGIGKTASNIETAASNFDQNVGLGPFDAAVCSLFQPPSS